MNSGAPEGYAVPAPLDEHDKHKLAFVRKYGLFQYTKLPFGLCNSPATFSRLIQLALQELTWKEFLAYLGRDIQDQIENMRRVFLSFHKYNLILKTGQCQLMPTKVKFHGKIVNRNGMSVNPDSIDAVKKCPSPQHKKEVASFIGFTNYRRYHINKFPELAEPLHRLTGTNNEFEWSEHQERAFQS